MRREASDDSKDQNAVLEVRRRKAQIKSTGPGLSQTTLI